MKKILAIALIFSFLAQQVTRLVIVINYTLNKEYIAKNICEQKDVAESTCEGKCHLKKQLNKEDEKEKTPANPFQEKFEVQGVAEYETIRGANILQLSVLKENYNQLISSPHLLQVFHPPCI